MSDKVTVKTGDDAYASSPASEPQLDSGFVTDNHLALDAYVDDSHSLRSGVLFDAVPSGPLLPSYLRQRGNTRTYFYCVTRGLKVGIVTDLTDAMAQISGVSNAMNLKVSTHSAALQYFNDELAKGNVKICQLRRPHTSRVLTEPSSLSTPPIANTAHAAAPPISDLDNITLALSALDIANPDDRTVYSVAGSGATTHWSEASVHQQRGAQVVNLSPRKKTRSKAAAWVVFIGEIPGVYTSWSSAEQQISGAKCSLYQSYRTLKAARAVYAYAQQNNWIHLSSALAVRHFQRVPLDKPRLVEHLDENPTASDVSGPRWYVVYAGIQPGVYRTFVESGLNWVGVPKASHESYHTLERARLEFRLASSQGRIIRYDVV
ncbi:hypothetical protein BDZ89DRAFT_1044260 [Hymenopellis radicata]|nr:hypothetical protein BDZ89DRAFT_1044260 [Hymenopellis radicata]